VLRNLRRQALVTSLAVTAIAAVSAAPAGASHTTVRDATSDVYSRAGLFDYNHEGSVLNTDLRSTKLRYRDGLLSVTATYVQLSKRGSTENDFSAILATKEHTYLVAAVADYELENTHVDVGYLESGTVGPIECSGAVGSASSRDDTISFSVPASCLGDAPWVRFKGGSASYSGRCSCLDNAMGANPRLQRFTGRLHDDG
jgi:hypothetical protein